MAASWASACPDGPLTSRHLARSHLASTVASSVAPAGELLGLFKEALAAHRAGQLDEAIAACRRSIELKPEFADVHYKLGNFLDDAGRPDEAEAAYRKAIALRPDHAESHCDLGKALWKQGKLAQALSSLERGHELGSRRKNWPYPSAEWVRECRELLERDGRPR